MKKLVLFHHDPAHHDEFLDNIKLQVQEVFPNAILAKESLVIDLKQEFPQPFWLT